MALTFRGTATSDRVNLGAYSFLNNLAAASWMVWCNPTDITIGSRFYQKGVLGTDGTFISFDKGPSTMQVNYHRASTTLVANATAANVNMRNNVWQCFCGVMYSSGANGDQHLYWGDLSAALSEAAAYASRTVGSGAHASDSAANAVIGNNSGNAIAFPGRISVLAMWNRALSLAELQSQQFKKSPVVTSGLLFFMRLGVNGVDLVDYGSNAVAASSFTGVTQSADVPLNARLVGGGRMLHGFHRRGLR